MGKEKVDSADCGVCSIATAVQRSVDECRDDADLATMITGLGIVFSRAINGVYPMRSILRVIAAFLNTRLTVTSSVWALNEKNQLTSSFIVDDSVKSLICDLIANN